MRSARRAVSARIACSSWSRRIGPSLSEGGLPLILGEQAAHRRHLAHLDGVAVEAGQDTVQAEHVAMPDKRLPAIEIAAVRLTCHAAAKPLEVAPDDWTPLLQAVLGQANGEPAVEPPGPPLGAGELGDRGP
jgi:hypothetical protein